MEDKNYGNTVYEPNENKAKTIWLNIGIGALALFVAVLTVLVINL